MKIRYRKPTLLELMDIAVKDSDSPGSKPIDYFELTSQELASNWTSFDRTTNNGIDVKYSYKGIPIKVTE